MWITPDDPNLDKVRYVWANIGHLSCFTIHEQKSGGLIIYTKPAPLDWDFDRYNSVEGDAGMQELLKDSGKVIVP